MESVEALIITLSASPNPKRTQHLHQNQGSLYTPLYYATELLRDLRKHRATYRLAQRHRPGRKWLDRLVLKARPYVREAFGSQLDGRVTPRHESRLGPLASFLDDVQNEEYPAIVLTRVVARAIEEEYSDTFWEQLRLYYDTVELTSRLITQALRPGDPVPVCNTIYAVPPGDDASRRGLYGTSPRSLPRWREPDRLGTIMLAPEGIEKFRVTLDFSFDSDLELLQKGRVATIHPSTNLDDEYCWDDDGHHLSGVRPRTQTDDPPGMPSADRLELLKASLDECARRGVSLAVLPELSVTEEEAALLSTHWQILARQDYAGPEPVMLVCGSYHHSETNPETDTRSYKNTSLIVGKGSQAKVDKIVPYVHREQGAEDGDLVEGITQVERPIVRIICGARMTMVTFICVDYLLDSLRDVLRDLDVTLTVLPSMSGKAQVFSGLVAGHVAATQGTVVMANAIVAEDGSRGLIGHPSVVGSVQKIDAETVPGSSEGAGVAVISIEQPVSVEWVPVSTPS